MEYTKEQIAEYITGWLSIDGKFDTKQIEAALHNALVCLKDPSDGIESYVERLEYYNSAEFQNEKERFTKK